MIVVLWIAITVDVCSHNRMRECQLWSTLSFASSPRTGRRDVAHARNHRLLFPQLLDLAPGTHRVRASACSSAPPEDCSRGSSGRRAGARQMRSLASASPPGLSMRRMTPAHCLSSATWAAASTAGAVHAHSSAECIHILGANGCCPRKGCTPAAASSQARAQ